MNIKQALLIGSSLLALSSCKESGKEKLDPIVTSNKNKVAVLLSKYSEWYVFSIESEGKKFTLNQKSPHIVIEIPNSLLEDANADWCLDIAQTKGQNTDYTTRVEDKNFDGKVDNFRIISNGGEVLAHADDTDGDFVMDRIDYIDDSWSKNRETLNGNGLREVELECENFLRQANLLYSTILTKIH